MTVPGRGYQFVSEQPELEPQAEVIVQRRTRAEVQIEEEPEEAHRAVSNAKWLVRSRVVWILASALVVTSLPLAFYLTQRRLVPMSVKVADSIAVLPFDTVRSGFEFEYLADGITETTIDHLSQSPDLKVISLGSVLHYRAKEVSPEEIGHALGVRRVLIGKVLIEEDRLIVLVELINTADGTHIWGEQYNRKVSEIIKVQEEISTEIATRL